MLSLTLCKYICAALIAKSGQWVGTTDTLKKSKVILLFCGMEGCIVSLIMKLIQQLLKLRSQWDAFFCMEDVGILLVICHSMSNEHQTWKAIVYIEFCSKQCIYSQKWCLLFAKTIFTTFYPWGPVFTFLYIRGKTPAHCRWKEIIHVQMRFLKAKHLL